MLEVRKTIDQGMLVDIIASGLPTFIMNKMNREEVLETQDLFNEIGKLEHLVKNKIIKQKIDAKTKPEKNISVAFVRD